MELLAAEGISGNKALGSSVFAPIHNLPFRANKSRAYANDFGIKSYSQNFRHSVRYLSSCLIGREVLNFPTGGTVLIITIWITTSLGQLEIILFD